MAAIENVPKGALLKEMAPILDKVVAAVNALLAGEVKITQTTDDKSTGKFLHADANSVLQLNLGGTFLPPFTDLDQAKTYALIATYDAKWTANWAEVCDSETNSLSLD